MKRNILILLAFFSLLTLAHAGPYSSSSATGPYSSNINPSTDGNVTYNITNNYNNYTFNGSNIYLDDLFDVNAAAPSDGEVLTWSSGLSQWIAQAVVTSEKWIIDESNGYLSQNGTHLSFDESRLNETIDSRAASADNDFKVFINGSAYNNIKYNMTAGDAGDIGFHIEPGKKFIFGDTFT